MNSIIPGHVRAFTWVFFLLACGLAWWQGNPTQALGIALIVIGAFFGDQATHLDQEAHSDPAPTYIERAMQAHKWFFQILGLLLICLGVWLAVS